MITTVAVWYLMIMSATGQFTAMGPLADQQDCLTAQRSVAGLSRSVGEHSRTDCILVHIEIARK